MATVVEDVIARFRWNTNRSELREARKDTEGLRKATEDLEDEVTRQAKAQAELRQELAKVRKERTAGKGDTKALKQREAELRSALMDQAEAAKAAKEALKTLKAEQRAAAGEARAAARAEAQAARERVRAAREVAKEQVRATREVAAAEREAAREAARAERTHERTERSTLRVSVKQERLRERQEDRDFGQTEREVLRERRQRERARQKRSREQEAEALKRNFSKGFGKSARERFQQWAGPEAAVDRVAGAASGASSLARGAIVGGAGALLAGGAGLGLGAAKVGMEFEQLRTALTTTTGSAQKADEAFGRIRSFAKSTPYDVQQVTNAFIKLTNRGLDASLPALRSYGDTASAMGKSLDDMVEAVADATVGEFERLKEFGVKASVQGDKVRLTFRGTSTEVQKDAASIEKYLIELGKTNFAGGMEAQSKTLAGVLGGLGDSIKMLLDEVFRGEFGTALKEVAADLGLFADQAGSTAPAISEVLAGAVRTLWATIKDFLGDPQDLGERIAGWLSSLGEAVTLIGNVAGVIIDLGEAAGPAAVAVGLLGIAFAGVLGPLGLVFAGAVALGAYLTTKLLTSMENWKARTDDIAASLAEGRDMLGVWRDRMLDLATSTDKSAAAFGTLMTRIAGSNTELERLLKIQQGLDKEAKEREAAANKAKTLDEARRNEAIRRQEAAEAAAAGMAARGGAAQQQKLRRFRELSKKKHRSPSESKELTTLSKELDLARPDTTKHKHKAESAYEADRDSEIKKLRQQAERRAGYRALLAGKSGAEQLSAAKTAGQATEDRLRARVAGGEALPGELNVGLLKSAGFNDVAGAGQPPPVAVTIVKVPEFSVDVTFSGPVTADLRMLRDEVEGVMARRLPEALADGLRNVRWPTIY